MENQNLRSIKAALNAEFEHINKWISLYEKMVKFIKYMESKIKYFFFLIINV
jgi:hypothetical protein